MTAAQWQASADPQAMIHWLERQGYLQALWDFTIACCRRIESELPGDAFRRVIDHAERIGQHDVDEVLAEASRAIAKLERQFQKTDDPAEQARLNRAIGFGRIVFAFDYQSVGESAVAISRDLVQWADDAEAEPREQADLLRRLVPNPSQRCAEAEGDSL